MAIANTNESYSLMQGDSDKQKRWGGTVYSTAAGEPVRNLQLHLAAVGCFGGRADGEFGAKTRAALKLFQWHLSKIRYRLNASGQAVPHPGIFPAPTGLFDPTTRTALAEFVTGQFTCAGPLVRVAFSRFSRFRVGVGDFEQLIPSTSSMVVDKEFLRSLSAMNAKAAEEGLYIYVNEVFRMHDSTVTGAIVPPARNSAHLLGRAIDMQLGNATRPQPSSAMVTAPGNSPIGRFRDHMIALGCRYGGFLFSDPPHYDRQIFPRSGESAPGEEWNARYYFAQRQLGLGAGTRATRVPVV